MARNPKAAPGAESDASKSSAGEPAPLTGDANTAEMAAQGDTATETNAEEPVAQDDVTAETNAEQNEQPASPAGKINAAGDDQALDFAAIMADVAPAMFTIEQQVICRVRAAGGPRRRAGLSFDEQLRDVTRADLGGDDETVEARLRLLVDDRRLTVLPPKES